MTPGYLELRTEIDTEVLVSSGYAMNWCGGPKGWSLAASDQKKVT